jgi:hypothetical protein
MAHLDREELLALAESGRPLPERHHAATCEACRLELESLRTVLAEVRDVDVPEPSPLFWDHFAARVREATSQEPGPRGSWTGWAARPAWSLTLGTAAAAAMLSVVLVMRPASPPATSPVANVTTPASDDSLNPPFEIAGGADWELVADVAGNVDLDEASAIGVGVSPGDADAALQDLSADEQGELVRIIRAELQKEQSS